MYDPRKYQKFNAAKNSIFKVQRMLQHLEKNLELYWYAAGYLIIDEQTIGLQGRNKEKFWIMFKYADDGL